MALKDILLLLEKKILKLLGRRFMVKGRCSKCGSCCKAVVLFFGSRKISSEEDFHRLCEAFPEYRCFKPERTHAAGFLIFSCSLLSEKNLCSNYRKRPPICRRFPEPETFDHMHRLPEGCTYTVTPLKDFDEFLYDEMKKR